MDLAGQYSYEGFFCEYYYPLSVLCQLSDSSKSGNHLLYEQNQDLGVPNEKGLWFI